MIAHLIEEELVPNVDLLIDLHSGGSSLMYLPSTQVLLQDDGTISPAEKELADAYGAPFNHVLHEEGIIIQPKRPDVKANFFFALNSVAAARSHRTS